MSDTTASLVRKIKSAEDLHSVVRTMKAIAGSRITQYENSVRALGDFYGSVELALSVYFRHNTYDSMVDSGYLYSARTHAKIDLQADIQANPKANPKANILSAVVFGSDQGLVGQFNVVLAEYVAKSLKDLPGKLEVWAIGERIHERLLAEGLPVTGLFTVPTSVQAIVPLVGRIQVESRMQDIDHQDASFFVFHNCPQPGGSYEPVKRRLLPLDAQWQQDFANVFWPNRNLPESMPPGTATLRALIGEYLFISIFRACAESLASENASRLAAMTRAERNIDQLSERLLATFHRLRQNGIDEELFDVVAGYEALSGDQVASNPEECAVEQASAPQARPASASGTAK